MNGPRAMLWIALVLLAVPAGAAESPVARALVHADADGDGRITLEELRKVRPNATPEEFRRYDTNQDSAWSVDDLTRAERRTFERDNALSKAEVKAVAPNLASLWFDVFDRDGDGLLSESDRSGAQHDARMRHQLHQADINRDGKVSWQEARQRMSGLTEAGFKRLDRNGDGFLTQADSLSGPAGLDKDLAKADRNDDGRVTLDEARTLFSGMTKFEFDRLDRNGDGVISEADRFEGIWDVNDRAAGGEAVSADVNGDGQVTYDELVSVKPGFPRERFDRIDANNDGIVTRDEALAAR